MKPFFTELFDYNHHVNQQLVAIMASNSNIVSDKAVRLFSHIMNAQQIWNNRIKPKSTLYGVWTAHAVEDFQQLDQVNFEHTALIINTVDLSFTLPSLQVRGRNFNKTVAEILFHIINHSTYHRGQIASEFRQIGIEPLATDYFLYEKQ